MITPAGFARAVQRHLIDPLGDLGLTVVSRSDFSVRFEGDGVFVQVDYDSMRSHELELWVGQVELPEPPFSLGDLLSSTDCPRDQVARIDLMQVSDEATLDRKLAMCAELLWVYGGPFLRGDVFAFAGASARRSDKASIYTARLVTGATIDKADAAWRRRDYDRVYDLLAPIRADLDTVRRRRLDLAERRRRGGREQ
jgi:hypothetical protein